MSYGQSNEIVNIQFRNLLSSFQKFHEYGPQSSLQKDHDDLEKLRLKYLKAVKYALDNPTALTAEINPEPSGRSVWRLVDQNLSGQELADMIDEGLPIFEKVEEGPGLVLEGDSDDYDSFLNAYVNRPETVRYCYGYISEMVSLPSEYVDKRGKQAFLEELYSILSKELY